MIKAYNRDKKMVNQEFDVGEYIEQMSLLLNLQINDEYKDGVIANFKRIKSIAEIVNSFHLPEEIEIVSIFEP